MGLFRATVSRVRDLTQDVRELELTLREPNEIIFKAGQFVSFDVPKEGYPYPVTRPYSIASPPRSRIECCCSSIWYRGAWVDVPLQPSGRRYSQF